MKSTELKRAAGQLIALAKERSQTIVTAESCTAGALVNLISEVPDAGEMLHGGFVVYTKDNKTSALGVPRKMLDKHTAVSAVVAEAMARGGLEHSPASLAIAITGVAGPEPDEDGNPVGLVYVAVARSDGECKVVEHRFGKQAKGDICAAAMRSALQLATEIIADV